MRVDTATQIVGIAALARTHLIHQNACQSSRGGGAIEEVLELALPNGIGGELGRHPVRVVLGMAVAELGFQVELRIILIVFGAQHKAEFMVCAHRGALRFAHLLRPTEDGARALKPLSRLPRQGVVVVVHNVHIALHLVTMVLVLHHIVEACRLGRTGSITDGAGRPFAVSARLAALVRIVGIGKEGQARLGREA